MSEEFHGIVLGGAPVEPSAPAETETPTPDSQTTEAGVTEASKGKASPKLIGIHVVVATECWHVKESGNSEVLFEHKTKKEAIKFATELAKSKKTELFIHGSNGKIQSRNSYGNDPKGGG